MAKLRRSVPLFFRCDDQPLLDIGAVLRGSIELRRSARLVACVLSTGEEVPVSLEEVRLLLDVPADAWVADDALDTGAGEIVKLVDSGLLLRDPDESDAGSHWHPYAALYHFMRRWRDVDAAAGLPPGLEQDPKARELAEQGLRLIEERLGKPPAHFHERPDAAAVRELPLVDRDGELYSLLRRRKTTRSFAQEAMSAEELSTVLRFTFGCHGTAQLYDDFAVLKKTSPSAGGLHPIEAYPLVVAVEDVEPGLYHYRAADHALEQLERLDRKDAEDLVEQFTAGQSFLRSAHALLVMTARFERSFWRYRDDGGYASLLLDAGHLSQTLYLVCTELGLGAFVTASLNTANIDERLGVDPMSEGAIAACGCGRPELARPALELDYDPYVPRRGGEAER